MDFHGAKRSNATHQSTTDPEARLARKGKGKEAKLAFSQHALIENRHGLLVDVRIDEANGRAEVTNAVEMLADNVQSTRPTVAGDNVCDTNELVMTMRYMNMTPHAAQSISGNRNSAIDQRTTRRGGCRVSQRLRKGVEEILGWTKSVANFRRTHYKGRARTQMASYFVAAAYNLLRISRLQEAMA